MPVDIITYIRNETSFADFSLQIFNACGMKDAVVNAPAINPTKTKEYIRWVGDKKELF